MGTIRWFLGILFVLNIFLNTSEAFLTVLQPDREANDKITLMCDGRGNPVHQLAHGSWVLVTGNVEQQIMQNISRDGGTLDLRLTHDMNGARVECRAHSRLPRHAVIVSPPLVLSVANAPAPKKSDLIKRVTASIGNVRNGALTSRAGNQLDVTCTAINMPYDKTIYIYIILQSESGAVETEINATIPKGTRSREADGRLTVRGTDYNSRIYCLARWFEDENSYTDWTALRSKPITLIIENSDSTHLWVAIGVGALGWVVAVGLAGLLLYVRQLLKQDPPSSSMEMLSRANSGCGCMGSAATDPLGATVLPMHAARSLAAANVKLTAGPAPTAPPPPPPQQTIYSNMDELNVVLKRRNY